MVLQGGGIVTALFRFPIRDGLEPVNVLRWDEDGFYFNTNKPESNAAGSWGRAWYHQHEFTVLRVCESCGKFGTPRKISHRNDCYVPYVGTPLLCCGCWNRARALLRKKEGLEALRKLVKQLLRTRPDAKTINH